MGLSLPLKCFNLHVLPSLLLTVFISIPISTFATSPLITPDSINLSAADFLPEFTNPSPERRTAARLYLLGVLDITEGKSWCSYNQLKTATINEFIFEYLQKQSAEKLKTRAAVLIEEALKHYFPCKDTK